MHILHLQTFLLELGLTANKHFKKATTSFSAHIFCYSVRFFSNSAADVWNISGKFPFDQVKLRMFRQEVLTSFCVVHILHSIMFSLSSDTDVMFCNQCDQQKAVCNGFKLC